MTNPLLHIADLPPFSAISPEQVQPAIQELLDAGRAQLQTLLQAPTPSWEGLIEPLNQSDDQLSRAWSPVSHLNAVMNNDALREAYNACLPLLSEYATEFGQNHELFQAYQTIAEDPGQTLNPAQRKTLSNALRDFRLAGVDLPPEQQARYKAIQLELSSLTSRFSENVLDDTNAWTLHITDEARLAGLPDTALALLKQQAQARELDGWVVTLEFPSYYPVISYADDSALRREVYEAYVTRASETGPHGGAHDNSELMDRILALRNELARLLGFGNFAEYSLATKMARAPEQVLSFLNDLAARARPQAQAEFDALQAFARDECGVDQLNAWDLGYYSEKLRQARYAISQEDLRPYFPLPSVLKGLFEVAHRLYDVRIRPIEDFDSYHPEVRLYGIYNTDGELRARFMLDPYARPNKRGGAWMDEYVTRMRSAAGTQTPVAYLVCNFSPPVGDDPALLTHDEVTTLFHEFGHGLHHMLTRVDYPAVSGINGVEWDAVELPSQFMENWCWEREALDLFAGHYQTGAALPDALLEKLQAARNFQSAMQMVRQLEFSLFDFRIHLEYRPDDPTLIERILAEVRAQVSVVPVPDFNRFAHGFSHIFAGGYAAGYYSYKWAEVLSADAFSAFEENGIFDTATGERFLTQVLEMGGARDALDNFIAFRGREPQIDALLRHSGIAA